MRLGPVPIGTLMPYVGSPVMMLFLYLFRYKGLVEKVAADYRETYSRSECWHNNTYLTNCPSV